MHETKKIDNEFPIGVDLQKTQDILSPVPISTKLDGDDVKQQVMDLYPDLFSGRSFISENFKQFAMEWSFIHKMSSPHYPKGNAHAE